MLPLPTYDALESVASPTEVGCYENLNPEHEESFIKEMDITLALFHCSTDRDANQITGCLVRMLHRKWRETKQQLN